VVWALNPSAAAVKRSLVAGDGTQETEQECAAADAINSFRTTSFGCRHLPGSDVRLQRVRSALMR